MQPEHSLDAVLEFLDPADFSIFGTVELHELVAGHSSTKWHSARFGVNLPNRPKPPAPSADPDAKEQLYIEKLLTAYTERHGRDFTATTASHDPVARPHYQRQRVAFYSAEALRVFARDAVPEGTFDDLQGQIYDGVIDTHDLAHSDRLTRLHEVSRAAQTLAITSNGLLPVVDVRDRTGICHQLANDDRLTW